MSLKTELEDIHSALDVGLGDSDPTWIENDDDLRRQYPLYWAAFKLALVIQGMDSNQSSSGVNAADIESLGDLADQWISDSEEAASYPATQPRGAIECAEDLHEWIKQHNPAIRLPCD